jgi:hypothetical protein
LKPACSTAVRGGSPTRSRRTRRAISRRIGLGKLKLGYGLPIATARDRDLCISSAIRDGEPPQFAEPGLFLVKPDGSLFYAARASAPWGRPPLDQMLRGIDVAAERKMPARGEA